MVISSSSLEIGRPACAVGFALRVLLAASASDLVSLILIRRELRSFYTEYRSQTVHLEGRFLDNI